MRKSIMLLMAFCLHLAARGQTGYEYDYWFDNDRQTLQSGSSESGSWQLQADVSSLRETLHAIHLQVRDKDGNQSSPVTRYFIKTTQSGSTTGRYWFDDAVDKMYTSAQVQGLMDIDVSQISEGLHSIHYQVVGTNGNISATASRSFYKMYMPAKSSWRCWFDNDYATQKTGNDMSQTLLLDVSELADGYHVLHIQVDGGAQSASTPITKPFVKIPQTIGVDDYTCLCMVDDQLYKQEKVPAGQGVVEWNFDVSSLPQGFHRIFVQIVTPSGAASNTWQSFFLRETTISEFAQMKCVYAIDGAEFYTEAGTLGDGTYHFDLDVSSLDDGLHRIAYMLSNGLGVTTKTQCQFFVKTPLGGNGITEYWYWLNDQADYNAKKVTLSERQDPFSFITLLPVESQPLRSSLFQFRVEQDKPIIHAKNDIHIRFYDASGRFTDVSKQFVDESVKQEVTDVSLLESGVRATMTKPEENEIKWYKVTAERGDSLTFKTDKACTLQLFSPTGEEAFSSSGSESVKCKGIHAKENGIYYLALHDVTATYGKDISIDYEHIDKYAVLRQNVAIVGNGGCSTITFEGNGFKDLYAVDFYNAQGDSIHHLDIGHESDATTSVTFDFTYAPKGKYHVKFRFTEGDVTINNNLVVEDAVGIELAMNVSFPSAFPHGKSTTYTVKITNKGNMTAYSVPIYTYIMNKHNKDGIYHIKYDGLGLRRIFECVDMDGMSESEKAELQALSDEMGDSHYFMLFRVENEDSPGDSVWIRSNYFFTNIAPYETKTLKLTLSANEGVWAYFTIPEDWPSFEIAQMANEVRGAKARFRSSSMKDKYCCIRSIVECFASLIADGASIANEILQYAPDVSTQVIAAATDCVAGAASKIISTAGTIMCDDNNVEKNFWDKVNAALDGTSTVSTLSSCLSQLLPWKKVKAILDGISKATGGASMSFGLGVDIANCAIAFTQKIPGCPPNPPGGGGSDGGGSWDPNDIYGYLSESGSKYMTDSEKLMNYTIEFENDTTFATAAAYQVVIKDTLNNQHFDLSSYAPVSVKIGDKTTELDGRPNFVTTIDMRPEIDAITQVEGQYDATKGIITWTFTSLDPMTMEPSNDIMQSFLPVNYDGKGIGEVSYNVSLKPGLSQGTQVSNRAKITFDVNEPILTPTWTNIVDATAPESHVSNVQMLNDSTVTVSIEASDELSGPWRYNVYVQYGSGAWFLAAENVPADTTASVKVYEGIDHGFYVVMTDSAGNVEQKEAASEYNFEVFAPQVGTDTKIQLAQGWNWVSHNQQKELSVEAMKPKSQRIVSQTDELYKDERIGWIGSLEELSPTELYKVKMAEDDEVQLSGKLFNAEFRSIPLYKGWNWIGYPVANAMTPAEALLKMEAEEGDFIVGQDGMATFTEGQWTGTLLTLEPGMGYMYRSQNNKNLFYNATAQSSSRKPNVHKSITNGQWPEDWTVDKRKYPNVMGLVADLFQDGEMVDANKWFVAAFCENECRGLSQVVSGHLMMNVYGTGGERITFMALNCENGEVLGIEESESFRSDILGTMQQPYELHSGMPTGIAKMDDGRWKMEKAIIYDLKGRRVENSSVANGVYIVTDSKKAQKHVNHKRKK